MTSPERETISQGHLRAVVNTMMNRRDRLAWAVEFAYGPMEAFAPGRRFDLRVELAAFLACGGGWMFAGMEIPLPTDEELQRAHVELGEILRAVLGGKSIHLADYHIKVDLRAAPGRASLSEFIDHRQHTVPEHARYALGRLLGELDHDLMEAGYLGPIIKVCPAPQLRAKREEVCGRWFVGRPNQVYCSSQC